MRVVAISALDLASTRTADQVDRFSRVPRARPVRVLAHVRKVALGADRIDDIRVVLRISYEFRCCPRERQIGTAGYEADRTFFFDVLATTEVAAFATDPQRDELIRM